MSPVKVKLDDDEIPTVNTKLSLAGVVSVPPLGKSKNKDGVA